MAFFLVMRFTLEHIVCSILTLTESWRLVRLPSTRHSHVALLLLSVQVTRRLERGSLRMRRTEMETTTMVVVMLQRLIVYVLLPLLRRRSRTDHPLHPLRLRLFEWRLLLRGRLCPGERPPGEYKLITHQRPSLVTFINVLHGRGQGTRLISLTLLLLLLLSPKIFDMLCLTRIG